MNMVERPGINERWLKNAQRKHKSIYAPIHAEMELERLRFYLANGIAEELSAPDEPPEKFNPPKKNWESFISTNLARLAYIWLQEWEVEAINNRDWNFEFSSKAICASELDVLISLHIHMMFPLRHGGRKLQRLNNKIFPFVVLAVIAGNQDTALKIAKSFLAATRKDYYEKIGSAYSAHFMMRIMADFLSEPAVEIKRNPLLVNKKELFAEPYWDAVFNVWREQDPEVLRKPLLAACDAFTHHAYIGADDVFREFSNGSWSRTPLAILLVFKLRVLLGFRNPELDHPLMNSVLGKLPPDHQFVPDTFIEEVRARMVADGLDEQALYSYYSA
jgi:hypothetical protein